MKLFIDFYHNKYYAFISLKKKIKMISKYQNIKMKPELIYKKLY